MKIDKIIRLIIGILILVGLGLGYYVNQYWYFLIIFVCLNLIQSVFTGFCGAEKVLLKLGFKK